MLFSIKIEASFLQFGYNYSILLIKSDMFHSIGSNRTVVLTGAKGSNRITLSKKRRSGGRGGQQEDFHSNGIEVDSI